ncbi:hypothetical protein BDN72DRAFT_831312 [Pluteus cervinus]|uniref:Uncharacterized protein n=1 Tax=Pluteus cervinus TaxID=181527 RepID=A0ACD3BDF5_9AGAR|nr:hypothetical protein BDN72DRAFT_831312 [Pluteus cervinus]
MSSPASAASAAALAAAAERRIQTLPLQQTAAQLAAEHDTRQKFRRLIDPGIIRPNAKDQAMSSLKTLYKIAENLIHEPENPKFRRFKPTNSIIKRDLMDPKGTLEYAIELGFRPEVDNFQPYYAWHPRHLEVLKIGATILKDYIDLETEKETRTTLAKKAEKAVAEAAAEKVKLAFMDDRKSKMQNDEREKIWRAARMARAAQGPASSSVDISSRRSSESPERNMPGAGHSLREENPPPPYHPELDTDTPAGPTDA